MKRLKHMSESSYQVFTALCSDSLVDMYGVTNGKSRTIQLDVKRGNSCKHKLTLLLFPPITLTILPLNLCTSGSLGSLVAIATRQPQLCDGALVAWIGTRSCLLLAWYYYRVLKKICLTWWSMMVCAIVVYQYCCWRKTVKDQPPIFDWLIELRMIGANILFRNKYCKLACTDWSYVVNEWVMRGKTIGSGTIYMS